MRKVLATSCSCGAKAAGSAMLAIALVATGGLPAQAATGAATEEDPFDSAQQALGLSATDAPDQAQGVTTEVIEGGAVVSLGEFDLKISAAELNTSTTVLEDGVRVMSLLDPGETSTDFAIELPEGAELSASNEGFDVIVDLDGITITVGRIAAPWAVDAEGKELPTSYSFDGDMITQHVDTREATYPVVADPAVTVGWGADGPGVYWNMYGYQAQAIAAASVATVGVALAGGCGGASKIPGVGSWIGTLCGFIGAPTLANVWSGVRSAIKGTSLASSSCYSMRIPVGSGLHKVAKSNCA